jgi:hypothetical protein
MNTSAPKQHADIDQAKEEEIQESIHQRHLELNITDGAEFTDDAIRMHDQPLGETTLKEDE